MADDYYSALERLQKALGETGRMPTEQAAQTQEEPAEEIQEEAADDRDVELSARPQGLLEQEQAAESEAAEPEEEPEKGKEATEVDEAEMLERIDEEIASMLRQSTALRDFVSEKYGVDLSKYQSDIQLIHGLVNAARLLGERAEKVKLFETLEERLGPETVQALLEGRLTVGEFSKVEDVVAEQAATAEAVRKTRFDLRLLEQVEVDPNTRQLVAKPGAPPDAPQKVLAFLEEREKLLNQFAADPESFLENVVDRVLKKKAKSAQEFWSKYSSQQNMLAEAQSRVMEWINQRAKALFVGGDPESGFTSFGSLVYNKVRELSAIAKPGTDPVQILNHAYELALAETSRSARPQASARPGSPSHQSGRTPAAPAPRRKTQEELIKEGLSLADAALLGE